MFGENSKWITFDPLLQSVNERGVFTLRDTKSVAIEICGLGLFEAYINDKRITADKFVPAWSNYCARKNRDLLYPNTDVMKNRAYYLRYDVSNVVRSGKNELCVVLGNGWFRQTERNVEGDNSYSDHLYLRYEIFENKNSVCGSDKSCTYRANEIVKNNVYFGEMHDFDRLIAGKEQTAGTRSAEETLLNTRLYLQKCPADRQKREFGVKAGEYGAYGRIYTVEKNIAGYAEVVSEGGDVTVTYAESLGENGELDFSHTGGTEQIQRDVFLNTRRGDILVPRFSWHAFSCFAVEGAAYTEKVCEIHADILPRVRFRSDNETLNRLFEAYVQTQLSNMHGGVPSDCPHRERLGYTGDGQITAETAMLLFFADEFYRKWIRDIEDCQDKKSGHVQHTAPFYGGGGGPGGWGSAIVIVPYERYMAYGNLRELKRSFPYMRKWAESMESFTDESGLIVREYAGGWCLGDWCTPDTMALPEPFVNTYYYAKALRKMTEICVLMGNSDEAEIFERRRKRSLRAIKKSYFNSETGSFCDGVQCADAFGIDLKLGNKKTLENLTRKYEEKGAFDTGMFGTEVLCRVLAQNGRVDLLFKLLTSKKFGSFGYMFSRGATTLWETWNGAASQNHPMFGGCVKQLVYTFAGIVPPRPGERGIWKIQPEFVNGLNRIDCTMETKKGELCLRYKKKRGEILGEVFVPAGVRAKLIARGRSRELVAGVNKFFLRKRENNYRK